MSTLPLTLITTLTVLLCMISFTPAWAADERMVALQYLTPVDDDRDIETLNLDISYASTQWPSLNLHAQLVITLTYATGNITQLEGKLSEGTLHEVRYNNSAFGVGPGGSLALDLYSRAKWRFLFQLCSSFIVYSERFPAGGDYYNVMTRAGPEIRFASGASTSIAVSFQRSHVSNGQGLGAQNPSYDAQGFALLLRGYF